MYYSDYQERVSRIEILNIVDGITNNVLGRLQVIIPFTLWWWKDLSQEVEEDRSSLAKVFKIWRIIATGTPPNPISVCKDRRTYQHAYYLYLIARRIDEPAGDYMCMVTIFNSSQKLTLFELSNLDLEQPIVYSQLL